MHEIFKADLTNRPSSGSSTYSSRAQIQHLTVIQIIAYFDALRHASQQSAGPVAF